MLFTCCNLCHFPLEFRNGMNINFYLAAYVTLKYNKKKFRPNIMMTVSKKKKVEVIDTFSGNETKEISQHKLKIKQKIAYAINVIVLVLCYVNVYIIIVIVTTEYNILSILSG